MALTSLGMKEECDVSQYDMKKMKQKVEMKI
jgi:hypothetical protein